MVIARPFDLVASQMLLQYFGSNSNHEVLYGILYCCIYDPDHLSKPIINIHRKKKL